MAAQAKPSGTCDSLPTAFGGVGSLCERMTPAPAAANAVRRAAAFPALPLGLYIHVPFCASTCDFCAFYQEKPRRQSIDLYLEAVAAELRQTRAEIERGASWLWQGEAGLPAAPASQPAPGAGLGSGHGFTVFFGGGTPGLLSAKDLDRLCSLVRQTLDGLGPLREWSIELAPSTVKADKVRVLLDHGVTRFSLGVQSFSEPLLDALGRQHSPKQALAAYETLRANGADNINCDLMFALPGQSREAWLEDLEKMRALGPEHISTYCLTFEEDTALWVKLSQGRYKLDPEHEAALYRETWDWLAAAGYAQYEVSNFAREGFCSSHNLATWQMSRWRGIGPSAASQWGGWRFQNPANIEGWAKAVLDSETRSGEAVGESAAGWGAGSGIGGAAFGTGDKASGMSGAEPGTGGKKTGIGGKGAALAPWPPVQTEQREALDNRLLAADALIFGLRRRAGVNKRGWLERFGGGGHFGGLAVATSADSTATGALAGSGLAAGAMQPLPLPALEALFTRLQTEGMLVTADEAWRLSDEGMLLADAVGSEILECFE